MLDTADLVKIFIELLVGMVPIAVLIGRLHARNVERFHDLTQRHVAASEKLAEIRRQLDHQDQCIDDMKKEALNLARSGAELSRRTDIEAELTRIRQAISAEITRTIGNFDTRVEELRERLRALEARAMRNANDAQR